MTSKPPEKLKTPLDKLKCYALRHKDLLNGYCRGVSSNVDHCDFASLDTHYTVRPPSRHIPRRLRQIQQLCK